MGSVGNLISGQSAAEVVERRANGRRQSGAGKRGGGLDAENDDLAGAVGNIGGKLANGRGVGAEIADADFGGVQPAQGAGGQTHVGGIEEHEPVGLQSAHEPAEIFGRGGGIDAAPGGMPEGAGEKRSKAIVAMAGVSDTDEQVHGGK